MLFNFIIALCLVVSVSGCTTFVVGRKATTDGSVMCSHTNDGEGTTDPRLVKIPARSFAPGSLRPIYASPENYPRYVGSDRQAEQYLSINCQAGDASCKDFEPIGYIPQVNNTFAYFESTYAILNEKQVGIGESTCSGVYVANSVASGGKALLSIDQLSQIALERASTAREAVLIIGELSEKYGFYGESNSFEGGSESLLITDPMEGWVFHILADPTGTSSIWAAARVPDDSVAVVANMFSIREIDLNDEDNFLGRKDLWEIAEKEGLWKQGEPLDFTATFSDGEYAHKYYSGRRMWSVFRSLSPQMNLPAEYGNLKTDKPYPFSTPVKKQVSPSDLFKVLRDWYGNSSYDTTKGLSAGAFATPDRYGGNAADSAVTGNWERTIALFRTSDSFVVQSRSWLPDSVGGVAWVGQHSATATAYVPVLLALSEAPPSLAWSYQGVFNLSTNFWAHRMVENVMQIKFSFMVEDVRKAQTQVEEQGQTLIDNISAQFASANSVVNENQRKVIEQNIFTLVKQTNEFFVNLAHQLIFKYSDGFINQWTNGKFTSKNAGYPVQWLQQVDYKDGPPPVEETKVSKMLKKNREQENVE